MRPVSPLALLLAGVALACYRPTISDGGFKCNMAAGAKACPDGFTCEMSTQKCWRNPDAAVETPSDGRDANMDADAMAGDATGDADGPVCFDSKPGCQPGTGTCDPACQTGCGCRQKCSINTAATLTCNAPRMQGFPRVLMDTCTIESEGSAAQTDNCSPGLVCIRDGCPSPRCFQFCQNDGDCTNASCTRAIASPDGGATGTQVCDVPYVDSCTPLGSNMNTGCGSGGTMSCYLSSSSPTHTICDCPFNAKGPGEACNYSRDCNRGLVCVDVGPPSTNPICLQVCRLSDNGLMDCPQRVAGACRPYLGIPRGTVSHPTYGYCVQP
jgi:hypothetical protein